LVAAAAASAAAEWAGKTYCDGSHFKDNTLE
jgi:hypothetical protein